MFLVFLRLGLQQIFAHKLRSFLTVLSIAIGAASIVAMTSLAQSGLATLTRGIEDVGGTRFIAIMTDAPTIDDPNDEVWHEASERSDDEQPPQ